jgi:hypothetical protein
MRYTLFLIVSLIIGGCGLNKPLAVTQAYPVGQPEVLLENNVIADSVYIINRAPSGMQSMDEIPVLHPIELQKLFSNRIFRKNQLQQYSKSSRNNLKRKK